MFVMDIWKRLNQCDIFAPEIDDQVLHSCRKTSIHQRFRQKFLPEKEAEKTRIFPQTFFPRLAPSSSVGQQTQVSGKESEVRFARKKSSLFEKAALGPHFASVFLFDLLGGRGSEKLSNWRKIHSISRIFDVPVVFISNGKKCGREGRGHVTIC